MKIFLKRMNKKMPGILLAVLILASGLNLAFADRIKDLTSLAGARSNQLVGFGIVVGLAELETETNFVYSSESEINP